MSYKIIGEMYHNDLVRKPVEMRVKDLDELFEILKDMSRNFSSEFGNYFPYNREKRIDYSWCGRIQVRNEKDSLYRDFWIYQIESESGIVYSNGMFTDGKKFCSKNMETWLLKCKSERKKKEFKFVED